MSLCEYGGLQETRQKYQHYNTQMLYICLLLLCFFTLLVGLFCFVAFATCPRLPLVQGNTWRRRAQNTTIDISAVSLFTTTTTVMSLVVPGRTSALRQPASYMLQRVHSEMEQLRVASDAVFRVKCVDLRRMASASCGPTRSHRYTRVVRSRRESPFWRCVYFYVKRLRVGAAVWYWILHHVGHGAASIIFAFVFEVHKVLKEINEKRVS